MDNGPSSSRLAPLDVIGTLPPHPATHVSGWCRIYNSSNYYSYDQNVESEHSWDAVVESAQTCLYCDAIVRGCRGWLDEDGKQDWTPKSLVVHCRDEEKIWTPMSLFLPSRDGEERRSNLEGRISVELIFASTSLRIGILHVVRQ